MEQSSEKFQKFPCNKNVKLLRFSYPQNIANFIKRKSLISEEWAANFKIDLVNDDTINNPEFFHALKKIC